MQVGLDRPSRETDRRCVPARQVLGARRNSHLHHLARRQVECPLPPPKTIGGAILNCHPLWPFAALRSPSDSSGWI